MNNDVGAKYTYTKNLAVNHVKSKAFDILGIVIILAMSLLSLGFVELRQLSWKDLVNMLVECIPLYLAATLLSVNYYEKGNFAGKNTEKYKETVEYYISHVEAITGKALSKLHDFCIYYNQKALVNIRTALLRSIAVTYEMYENGSKEHKALKDMTKSELLDEYGKRVYKIVHKCNTIKIKGISVNLLMGDVDSGDATDLGCSESQLKKGNLFKYAGVYLLTVVMMSFIGIKDVMQWGWMGAALTFFKVLYISAGAYMKYFDGYDDVVSKLVNHLNRKTDVIMEFDYWLESEKDEDETVIK